MSLPVVERSRDLGATFAALEHRMTHCRLAQRCCQMSQKESCKNAFRQQASASIVFKGNVIANVKITKSVLGLCPVEQAQLYETTLGVRGSTFSACCCGEFCSHGNQREAKTTGADIIMSELLYASSGAQNRRINKKKASVSNIRTFRTNRQHQDTKLRQQLWCSMYATSCCNPLSAYIY